MVNYVWPVLDCSKSAEKISRFVPSTGTNLAWDGGQVKFVNILSIRANRNLTEGYPGRCRGVLCETGQGNSAASASRMYTIFYLQVGWGTENVEIYCLQNQKHCKELFASAINRNNLYVTPT